MVRPVLLALCHIHSFNSTSVFKCLLSASYLSTTRNILETKSMLCRNRAHVLVAGTKHYRNMLTGCYMAKEQWRQNRMWKTRSGVGKVFRDSDRDKMTAEQRTWKKEGRKTDYLHFHFRQKEKQLPWGKSLLENVPGRATRLQKQQWVSQVGGGAVEQVKRGSKTPNHIEPLGHCRDYACWVQWKAIKRGFQKSEAALQILEENGSGCGVDPRLWGTVRGWEASLEAVVIFQLTVMVASSRSGTSGCGKC